MAYTGQLTGPELEVIERLAQVYNLFCALPLEHTHPSDREEFAAVIHQAQRFVMARSAVRMHPETFVTIGGGVSQLA